jgi:hypothetical protein
MNGPHRDGFHDAMKVELTVNTLNINVLLGCCRTFAFYECVSYHMGPEIDTLP